MNWTDICEKLPQEGIEVLVLVKRRHDASACEIAYLLGDKWITCMRGEGDKEPVVSHWQSFPNGPTCEKDDKARIEAILELTEIMEEQQDLMGHLLAGRYTKDRAARGAMLATLKRMNEKTARMKRIHNLT